VTPLTGARLFASALRYCLERPTVSGRLASTKRCEGRKHEGQKRVRKGVDTCSQCLTCSSTPFNEVWRLKSVTASGYVWVPSSASDNVVRGSTELLRKLSCVFSRPTVVSITSSVHLRSSEVFSGFQVAQTQINYHGRTTNPAPLPLCSQSDTRSLISIILIEDTITTNAELISKIHSSAW